MARESAQIRAEGPRRKRKKRLKGLEPSTFCMASRRSSQLSYSRNGETASIAPGAARQPLSRAA